MLADHFAPEPLVAAPRCRSTPHINQFKPIHSSLVSHCQHRQGLVMLDFLFFLYGSQASFLRPMLCRSARYYPIRLELLLRSTHYVQLLLSSLLNLFKDLVFGRTRSGFDFCTNQEKQS